MFCAGHQQGKMDACLVIIPKCWSLHPHFQSIKLKIDRWLKQGDSGGPLVVNDRGRWTLVGITSAGFGCAVDHQPGIYHKVSKTVPWILANINDWRERFRQPVDHCSICDSFNRLYYHSLHLYLCNVHLWFQVIGFNIKNSHFVERIWSDFFFFFQFNLIDLLLWRLIQHVSWFTFSFVFLLEQSLSLGGPIYHKFLLPLFRRGHPGLQIYSSLRCLLFLFSKPVENWKI